MLCCGVGTPATNSFNENVFDIMATSTYDARMATKQKPMKVSDQLRSLIRNSGVTCYQIAKATGVSNAALSRFLSGERGLSSKALDILGVYFGWEIVKR